MYLNYYRLQDEPFRLTPDPRYLYPAEPHRAALITIIEGVLQRKGLLMVSGPVGTGKTTVLHGVLQVLSDRRRIQTPVATAFVFHPTLTRDEFLEILLDEFEIQIPAGASKPRRLAALHEMLLDLQRRGGTAALFVDEAHLLSPDLLEEIRLLSNIDTHHDKLLQIILFGQPELTALLGRPELRALRQRVSTQCSLRPLSLPETRSYIAVRLHTAGLRGPSLFASEAVDAIYQCTRGVPRLINSVADHCLTIGFRTHRAVVQRDIVEETSNLLDLTFGSAPQLESDAPPKTLRYTAYANRKTAVDSLIEALKQGREAVQE